VSITMREDCASENMVPSLKVTETVPSAAVEMMSFW